MSNLFSELLSVLFRIFWDVIFWIVMFPIVWIVSLPFILVIALFRKRPYWRTVVEMLASVHGFWCDCFQWV
jgi:hypothetical protein